MSTQSQFPASIPVTIRGRHFPSMSEAARILGVTQQSISYRFRQGTLDQLGQVTKAQAQPRRRSVVIRGTSYDSLADAARALGVAYQTVQDAARAGCLDGVGLHRANGWR